MGRDRVLDRYCKLILGPPKATPKKVSMIECGKYCTTGEILVRIVKYRMRITRMGGNEILNSCYNFQVRNNNSDMKWAALLKHDLDSIGLGYIWIQEVKNEISTLKIVRQRSNGIEQQNINSMNGKITSHFYKLMKRE